MMMADGFAGTLSRLLISYGMALPYYIVYGVGIALALARWGRHPRISMFALIGFGGSLVFSLITVPLYQLLPMALIRNHNYQLQSTVMTVITVTSSLLHTGCFAFLVAAIFCGRDAVHSPAQVFAAPAGPVAQASDEQQA